MAYSTVDSVKKKIDLRILKQLLNDEVRSEAEVDLSDSNDPCTIRFNEAATEAQAEVDPYLIGRYTLPFAAVPVLIIAISDQITIHNIYKRRGDVPESEEKKYSAVVKMLEKIEAGKMDLGISDEPQSIRNEIRTNKTAEDRIFNKDLLDKF